MNKFMKKLMKKDGFTLVELIVVIAILAILAGVAIPAYSGYITKAQDAAVITELDAIATAAQAANASAGEIEKIEVVTSGTKTEIKVYGKAVDGDSGTTYPLAKNFGDDFELYYGGEAKAAGTDGTVTIELSKVILNGSYAEDPDDTATVFDAGATWCVADEATTTSTKFEAGWNEGVAHS